MRVAFVIPHLELGGAQRQLVLLAEGLHRRGHDVRVFLSDASSAGRSVGVPVEGATAGNRVRRLLALAVAVRRFRPDVVHGYLDAANLAVALIRPLVGRCAVVWGVRMSDLDRRRWSRTGRLVFRATRALARVPDLIVANSHAGRDHHVALGYPAARTVVVPNGIDADAFAPRPEEAAALRHRWEAADAAVVGCLARFDPMKGHASLVRAAADVLRVRPDAVFVCVGPDPDGMLPGLRALAEESGVGSRFRWEPAADDAAGVLSAFDVCCLPSLDGEGFPNVVAEAMACGTPCVVTDVGDAADIVDDLGAVVRPDDPEALAAALVATLERHPPAEDLRRWVVERFGADRLVGRTAELLSDLLARGPSPGPARERRGHRRRPPTP